MRWRVVSSNGGVEGDLRGEYTVMDGMLAFEGDGDISTALGGSTVSHGMSNISSTI